MESYFFPPSLSLFQLDFKPWNGFKPHFFSSYHSFFFLPFFFLLFYTSFSPSLFHPLFGPPLISSSPAFLPFFILLFFCHSISSSSFFFFPLLLPLFLLPLSVAFLFSLSSLYFILLVPSSFPPPLSFSLFFSSFLPFNHFFPYLFHLFAKGAAIKQRLNKVIVTKGLYILLPPPCPTACLVPQLSLQYRGENTG